MMVPTPRTLMAVTTAPGVAAPSTGRTAMVARDPAPVRRDAHGSVAAGFAWRQRHTS